MRVSDIASALGIAFGGEDKEITAMNNLRDARPDELSFAANRKHIEALRLSDAGAVLIPVELLDAVPPGAATLVHEDVLLAMAYATKLFASSPIDFDASEATVGKGSFIDPRANIEKGAKIGKGCTVMAGAYIGSNVVIGDESVIYPNAAIYRDCKIGQRCIIHAGTTVGGDGFGFSHTKTGEHVKIYQNGNVVIEDDVELGCNCTVDRAVFASTVIKKGVKIDNLVHIGHNCEIGEYSILVAQVGVAGSTKLGRNTVVSGQSAFAEHLEIAPFTTFTARSGVTKSIHESGKVFSGYPLMEHRQWMRLQSKLAKLVKEQ
jgi:UDP-3-O-[3-hydroxymyristoyl] glucosamine N-acyltransferase